MSESSLSAINNSDQRLDELETNWGWLLALGILWITLGTIAVVAPFAAGLALELLLGAIFAVGGFAQMFQAWRGGWRRFSLMFLGGFLAATLGILLIVYPLQGILTLTLLLGGYFVVDGVVRIAWAFQTRVKHGWVWNLLSGILGVIVGIMILAGWPSTAAWAIGLLVAVALIFGGWSTVMLALAARPKTR